MISPELADEILRSTRFSSALVSIATRSVVDALTSVELDRAGTEVDWGHALFCSSAISSNASEAAQDAALRVVQGCLTSDSAHAAHREAAAVLLERMGNRLALNLATQRNLIGVDGWNDAPAPLQLDVLRRRLELTIGTTKGSSVAANVFQRAFWDAATANSWISVSAPTSAGKSYIVKRWFEERFAVADSLRSVYLVPTRALIEEVSQDLRNEPGFSGIGIYTLPWDPSIGSTIKEIHVVTQERLHVLQQRFPSFAPGLIFVDEAQKFGDESRGVLLQRVLGEVVRRNNSAQIMLASPLAANPEVLLEYAPEGATRVAVTSNSVTVNQNLLWVNQVKGKTTAWRIQLLIDGREHEVGGFKLPARPTPESKRLSLVAATLGRNQTGNVVYINGAAAAEKAAQQIYDALGADFDAADDANLNDLRELIEKTIHPQYALAAVLRRRVAFHYGNMPLLVRAEIERLFRIGTLRYLVCTSTLLEGVNLPCTTLFVRGPKKGNNRPMSAYDFWNLAGRAGRWGKEFQGTIVCVDTSLPMQWPEPPRSRTRQPLRRASDDVTGDVQRLLQYIAAGTPLDESAAWASAESVFSLLADRVARGVHVSDVAGIRLSDNDAVTVQRSIAEALGRVELPLSVFGRHAGVSPLSMQRLLEYFRNREAGDALSLPQPEDPDAAQAYDRAISGISSLLGGSFGNNSGRQMQLAILLVNWMRGQPLARLIAERVQYNTRRANPQNLSAVIRDTMTDVEKYARFEAPKYLGCYVDVLRYFLGDTGQDAMAELPDIEMMLELGVSRKTELSLMTLGMSRTSAIALSEYIVADNLTPEECVDWIRQRDLTSLDVPELVRREIAQHQAPDADAG